MMGTLGPAALFQNESLTAKNAKNARVDLDTKLTKQALRSPRKRRLLGKECLCLVGFVKLGGLGVEILRTHREPWSRSSAGLPLPLAPAPVPAVFVGAWACPRPSSLCRGGAQSRPGLGFTGSRRAAEQE